MANLTPEWLQAGFEVTGGFETTGNPWAGVSNDFDKQGISCGILQWNIGQGSLQPLVNKCGLPAVQQYMPVYGNEFWNACQKSKAKGLEAVRTWQPNGKLRSDVLKELRTFFGSPEMIKQQMAAATEVGEKAMVLASRWANDSRAGQPVLKEFCLFFDLLTQSGGMRDVWLDDVKAFIAKHGRAQVDNVICDWITSRPSTVQHLGDGHKNAALWKNNVADADLELFTLAYLRCLKSKVIYQVVAFNRRGTIVQTRGWVNKGLVDLPKLRNASPIVPNAGTTTPVTTEHIENLIATDAQKFVVNNEAPLGLNLRSAPNPGDDTNIIATLSLHQEVIRLGASNVANWWNVRATIDGITKDGYVNRKFLSPAGSDAQR